MKHPIRSIRDTLATRSGAPQRPAQAIAPKRQGGLPAGESESEGEGEGVGESGDGAFNDIVDGIVRMVRQGELPEGMDPQTLLGDEAFLELTMDYPVEAAVRIYAAEKRADEAERAAMDNVTAKVRSRSALPKSTRGGGQASPQVNYHDMDSETFRRVVNGMKKTARDGGRSRL